MGDYRRSSGLRAIWIAALIALLVGVVPVFGQPDAPVTVTDAAGEDDD
ncbi:MAG: hypothetical protein U0703_01130 [Anaerolineae bacterium]